jgi:hypothetical protein
MNDPEGGKKNSSEPGVTQLAKWMAIGIGIALGIGIGIKLDAKKRK